MRLALRTILCAGLFTLLWVPLASAQGWDYAEMITYRSLVRAGNSVYGYAYSDLYHPDPWAHCPANQDDYWNGYSSYSSVYLSKNEQLEASDDDEQYGEYSEAYASAYVDAGEWTVQTEHDVDVEWEDWFYQVYYYPSYDMLHDIQSDPYDASTLTDAHWYAYPNGECSAQWSSTYSITATVGFQSGPVSDWTYLWVGVPWTTGGETTHPTVQGTWSRQLVNGVWKVTGTNFTRTSPAIIIHVPASSQFRDKLEIHEGMHNYQFTSGMLSDLWIPADLHNLLIVLTASTEAGLVALVNGTTTTYLNGEAAKLASRKSAAEAEAYGLSDQFSPQYLYQNCGRF